MKKMEMVTQYCIDSSGITARRKANKLSPFL